MSVRRVALSSFVLLLLAQAACVVANDFPNKPVLGSAVPIGELLVLKADIEFDDDVQLLPPAPISLLEPSLLHPVPRFDGSAECAAPEGLEVLRATALITPGEKIGFHLYQAFLGLTDAGLNEEAGRVGSLLSEFETKHQPRLLLAAKQAQLKELQVEIDRLKLRVEKGITADQIQISVKVIEVDGETAKALLVDDAATNRLQTLTNLLGRDEFLRLVESKRKDGSLKVLAEPTLVTLSGRPARFRSGGSIPTPQIVQLGGPAELEYGTTVLTTATILDKDLIRVELTAEYGELNQHKNGDVPTVNKRRVQSTLELKDGQTVVVSGLVNSTETKTVATIFTVTAEIIESADVVGVPLAIPVETRVEFPQPTPTPIRLVK